MKYMTFQVEIENPRELLCYLENPNGFLLKLGEDGRLGKGGHMEKHEHTPEFELDLFFWMDWEEYKNNYVYKT